jgi:AraC-like DNA-binding protein
MKSLSLNVYNIIILLGIIQGVIFSLVIFFNKKFYSKSNVYLAYTSISLSLSNLQYWFTDTNLVKKYVFLDWLRIPSEFLMIPMFYFFVCSYLEEKLTKNKKILLIIPFCIDFIFQLLVMTNTLFFKGTIVEKAVISKYFLIEEVFSLIFSSSLIYFTLSIVNKYEKLNRIFDLDIVKAKTKWIKQILIIGLLACVFWVSQLVIMKSTNAELSIYYPVWISVSIIIYWLSYVGLFNSSLYMERKNIRYEIIDNTIKNEIKKVKNFNSQSQEEIYGKFESYINIHYVNPNLSLDDTAIFLEISSNYLSQIINSKNIKFNDYLNSIRVEKVKTMLKDESFSKYTITAIGLEAGFNSNASFYRAFKKNTNVSPSDYRISN